MPTSNARTRLVLVACVLGVPFTTRAQAILTTVAAAEAEGKAHRSREAPEHVSSVFQGAVGTAERRCVTPSEPSPASGTQREKPIGPPARSGEFVIGGQISGAARLTSGRPAKIWWAALHQSVPVLVRAARLDSPADTVRFEFTQSVFNPGRQNERFTPSNIELPSAGTWLVVATTGADWGCYLLRAR